MIRIIYNDLKTAPELCSIYSVPADLDPVPVPIDPALVIDPVDTAAVTAIDPVAEAEAVAGPPVD